MDFSKSILITSNTYVTMMREKMQLKEAAVRERDDGNSKRLRRRWRKKLQGLNMRLKSLRTMLVKLQQRLSKPSGLQKLSMMHGMDSGTSSMQSKQ